MFSLIHYAILTKIFMSSMRRIHVIPPSLRGKLHVWNVIFFQNCPKYVFDIKYPPWLTFLLFDIQVPISEACDVLLPYQHISVAHPVYAFLSHDGGTCCYHDNRPSGSPLPTVYTCLSHGYDGLVIELISGADRSNITERSYGTAVRSTRWLHTNIPRMGVSYILRYKTRFWAPKTTYTDLTSLIDKKHNFPGLF
jgi:hypothetical protein